MQTFLVLVFCIAVIFNALANILIKFSASQDLSTPSGLKGFIHSYLNPIFLLGLTCFGFALIGYKYVLGKGLKLSLAYPVFTSSGFLIVLVVSAILFKERLSLVQWIGIAMILIGVWLTALHMFDKT
jgi:multidrug transporter EmrE-like cation transporter